jgi:hypothetical protein
MRDRHDGDDISVSARVPVRTILSVLGGVLFGGLGIGAFIPKGVEVQAIQSCFDNAAEAKRIAGTALGVSERSADLTTTLSHVIERHGNTVADQGVRITNGQHSLEALRISVSEWSRRSVTEKEAAQLERKQERTTDDLKHDVDKIERDVDQLQSWHGKE